MHTIDIIDIMKSKNNFRILEQYKEHFDYSDSPLLIYWESTRACELACTHCRAEAVPFRHPNELRTQEVKNFFDDVKTFKSKVAPKIVVTGGDPLLRPDLFELLNYASEIGLELSVTPAGTKRLNIEILKKIKDSGVKSLGLSLDGSCAEKHDSIRQVKDSFKLTAQACRIAVDLGFDVQINSIVSDETLNDIPAIYQLIKHWGIARWALFFLIATGRGQQLSEITDEQSERFMNYLNQLIPQSDFPIKTTEAHHFRRIVYNKMKNRGMSDEQILQTPVGRGFGIRDANGIVFVSHTGEVYPSGFLPLKAGSLRDQSINQIYCNSELFKSLRNTDNLRGKCARCEFKLICGGSRSRAYSESGDVLESDPLCIYESSNDISMMG